MLVVFEGIDGAGKTTLLHALAERLEKYGYLVFTIHNPRHTPFYEALQQPLDPHTKLFVYASAHSYIAQKVKEHSKLKAITLVDRYIYSTLAYQHAEGLPVDLIWKVCSLAVDGVFPTITFLIDLPVEEAYRRKPELDKEFLEKVRQNYLKVDLYRDEVVLLDGTLDVKTNLSYIEALVLGLISYGLS